eukprot:1887789-Rhodomonas_salina.1
MMIVYSFTYPPAKSNPKSDPEIRPRNQTPKSNASPPKSKPRNQTPEIKRTHPPKSNNPSDAWYKRNGKGI